MEKSKKTFILGRIKNILNNIDEVRKRNSGLKFLINKYKKKKGLYVIINKLNNKIYLGSSTQIGVRLTNYLEMSLINKELKKDLKRYGWKYIIILIKEIKLIRKGIIYGRTK